MSVLGKFKNSDGFVQLMRLLEISEPSKQKNLLRMLGDEDPGWARLVQIKMLSREKILAWPTDILAGVLRPLDAQIIAALLSPTSKVKEDRFRNNVKGSIHTRVYREVMSLIERKTFDEQKLFAATVKLIQTVREMEQLGIIDLGQVDERLRVDQKLVA